MPVRQSAKTVHRITKDDLIFLLDKNDFKILDEVNRIEFGFIAYLEKRRYSEQTDEAQILEIVLRILSRVCSLRGEKISARLKRFLRMLRDCDQFLFDDIPRVINKGLTKSKGIDLVLFMANYMSILKILLRQDFFPCSRIVEKIFPELENYMNRMREMRLKNLVEAEDCISNLRREVECYESASFLDDDDDNDICFRDLSIVPRSNDIVNYEIPKIPQNIIDGPYKSVDHYLSVHFRLIREDMLRSFRECIKMCISSDRRVADQNKNQSYEKVTVKFPPEYGVHGIYYDIVISCSKEVDWSERSEKGLLKPGSLVFLTPDKFQSVIFATVANNPKTTSNKSKECKIKIKLEDDTFTDELKDTEYEMIEPAAYFECYKHVLSGMKELSESNFPIADMIVYLDFKDPESSNSTFHPEYLEEMQYCLHENCDGTVNDDITCSCKVFDPLKDEEWPAAADLKLDDQQFIAFKTAITKKVAVIQGPPGTGKTYVGGKVVKALLQNNPHKPIVICCLTNHALDQFLEGILKLNTKKVVRLGSQSKSEVLEPYKMDNMIYAIHEHHRGNVSDKLKDSLNLVKLIANRLLEDKEQRTLEVELSAKRLCEAINSYLKHISLCKEKYLHDNALNDIIDGIYKDQLRNVSGSIRKSLSDSILEWLLCCHTSDLYAKCDKIFEQLRREEFEFPQKVPNIWALNEAKRFKLFYFWRIKCLKKWEKKLDEHVEIYKTLMRRDRIKNVNSEKLEIVRGADIIGLTTTGASKYKDLIRFSEPRILVIEEAAQVLEAHIIASLVPSIQHIILIGDHEQLRPLPANHELSEKYNLKISMFERLFRNGAPSATLVSQHRMKPCIAELLVPVPYETYTSHKDVYKYEEIRGVQSSVFFFDHQQLEDKNSSGTSSSNDFEARMIVHFTKYLLLQSYSVKDITILATYGAQVALILKYLEELKGIEIRVTTVDNFQGEESNIILISFVRSNPSVIGFLKESNRVCVALSRAKMGMFCFGNFQHFSNKSKLWSDIVQKLRTKDMIGDTLSLKCERHQVLHPVKSESDISKFIDTGCSQICNFLLLCQHKCTRSCHFYDPDHLQYLCKEPCKKMIDENRICSRLCYEKCKRLKKKQIQLPCGHMSSGNNPVCNVETPRLLPCRHVVTVPCHLDMAHFKCRAAVQIKLNCGHKKTIHCHEQQEEINVNCSEPRPEMGPCGHIVNVPCSLRLDENDLLAFCNKACDVLLKCGHPCVNFCRFCFDVGIHGFCTERCDLKLPCGHECKGYCYSPCPSCTEKCFLTCVHGTPCINACLRPCSKCEKPCARVCEHDRCTKLCYEDCSIDPCMEPCPEVLECGHPCIGLCGDPCPYLCRICHADDLNTNSENSHFVELECEHVIEVNELTKHIEDCLISLDWPDCPQCNSVIKCSLRYKKQLMHAKKMCIDSCDTSSDIAEIRYLVQSMYGQDFIVPARFLPIHNNIIHILNRENPKTNTLLVLKNCVMLLKKLVIIAPKLDKFQHDERIQGRFETLLLWITQHLTTASYQQLQELESSLNQLKNDVS